MRRGAIIIKGLLNQPLKRVKSLFPIDLQIQSCLSGCGLWLAPSLIENLHANVVDGVEPDLTFLLNMEAANPFSAHWKGAVMKIATRRWGKIF